MNFGVLESELHAVERVPAEGRGKPAQFIPIRFLFTNRLSKDDKLLLALDAFALSKSLGREVSVGRIIHGDDGSGANFLKLSVCFCRVNDFPDFRPPRPWPTFPERWLLCRLAV